MRNDSNSQPTAEVSVQSGSDSDQPGGGGYVTVMRKATEGRPAVRVSAKDWVKHFLLKVMSNSSSAGRLTYRI